MRTLAILALFTVAAASAARAQTWTLRYAATPAPVAFDQVSVDRTVLTTTGGVTRHAARRSVQLEQHVSGAGDELSLSIRRLGVQITLGGRTTSSARPASALNIAIDARGQARGEKASDGPGLAFPAVPVQEGSSWPVVRPATAAMPFAVRSTCRVERPEMVEGRACVVIRETGGASGTDPDSGTAVEYRFSTLVHFDADRGIVVRARTLSAKRLRFPARNALGYVRSEQRSETTLSIRPTDGRTFGE